MKILLTVVFFIFFFFAPFAFSIYSTKMRFSLVNNHDEVLPVNVTLFIIFSHC